MVLEYDGADSERAHRIRDQTNKEVEQLISSATTFLRFRNQSAKNKLSIVASKVSLQNRDYPRAYEQIRSLCFQHPHNMGLWNAFNKLTAHLDNFLFTQKVATTNITTTLAQHHA
jgi:hypothetical protein